MQTLLFQDSGLIKEMAKPPKGQLLKWIGNKQRFARSIVSFFPDDFHRYHEPFLGSGAVLGTLAKEGSVGADSFQPLAEIWQTLAQSPDTLKRWYEERWRCLANQGKKTSLRSDQAVVQFTAERRRSAIPVPVLLWRGRPIPPSGWVHVNALRGPHADLTRGIFKKGG